MTHGQLSGASFVVGLLGALAGAAATWLAAASPWLGLAGRCAVALLGLLAYEHAYVQAGPVGADLVTRSAGTLDGLNGRRVSAASARGGRKPAARPSTLAQAAASWPPIPPRERWGDWTELDSKSLARAGGAPLHRWCPTTCFNCESACGPARLRGSATASRCASSRGIPSTPDRGAGTAPRAPPQLLRSPIRTESSTPLRRVGERGYGRWERVRMGRGARRDRGARSGRLMDEGPAP